MKQVIVVRSDLDMGKGKIAAQAAHASLSAYQHANPEARKEWEQHGQTKVVAKAGSESELKELYQLAKAAKLPAALITDAGRTQIEPGTVTALAIGHAADEKVDKITGKLKLL